MTREEMWKEFEYQLIRETRISMTMSFDAAQRMTKLGIEETVAKWKRRLDRTRWIPVSERLPEKNVWVLVTVVQGSVLYVEIMRIDKYKGMFTDNIGYYGSVIAWMPLPEPYKAESEDKE